MICLAGTTPGWVWWHWVRGPEVVTTARQKARAGTIKRKWPALGAHIPPLQGSRLLKIYPEAGGIEVLNVRLRKAVTAEDVMKYAEQIASTLGVRKGGVTIVPDDGHAGNVEIRITRKDPLAVVVPYRMPVEKSAGDPIWLGCDIRGADVSVYLFKPDHGAQHMAIYGKTGGGKSNTMNVIVSQLALREDVALYGIDLKGGVELKPWMPRMNVAHKKDDAVKMVNDISSIIQARAEAMENQKIWTVTPETPHIVLIIDEGAEFRRQGGYGVDKALESIGQLGRAVAVSILWLSQRAVVDAIPSGLRSQITQVMCHQVRDWREAGAALAEDAEMLSPQALKHPGSAYVIGVGSDPIPMRVPHQTDNQLAQVLKMCEPYKPELDEVSEAAVKVVSKSESHQPQHAEYQKTFTIPNSRAEHELVSIIKQYLATAGQEGRTRQQIMDDCNPSSLATCKRVLADMMAAQIVENYKYGTYRLVATTESSGSSGSESGSESGSFASARKGNNSSEPVSHLHKVSTESEVA